MSLSAATAHLPPPLQQIKSNTGLRGIAALLVVAYHLRFAGYFLPFELADAIISRGYLVVDLFFILSGFILSYANKDNIHLYRIKYKSFMLNRIIRIYPLHLFCLLYLLFFSAVGDFVLYYFGHESLFGNWSLGSIKLLVAQMTLTNGWFFTQNGWNTPTWSISVEILAYAIFPILSVFLTRNRVFAIIMLASSIIFYIVIAFMSGKLDVIGRIAILRCLAGFALGMIICDQQASTKKIPDRLLSTIQIILLILIILMMECKINDFAVIPMFAGLVYVTSDDRGILSDIIEQNVFQFLGKISYSIYLNHVCLLIIILPVWSRIVIVLNRHFYFDKLWTFPIFFVVVIIVSVFTYRFVELTAGRFLKKQFQVLNRDHLSTLPSAP